jgi:hypothetical protein
MILKLYFKHLFKLLNKKELYSQCIYAILHHHYYLVVLISNKITSRNLLHCNRTNEFKLI